MTELNVEEQMKKSAHLVEGNKEPTLKERIREHTEAMEELSLESRDEVIEKLDRIVNEFVDYAEEQSRRLQEIKETLEKC